MPTVHMGQSVKGALRNWRDEDYEGFFTAAESGRIFTASETRNKLLDMLEAGVAVIPFCEPSECPDFDYSGGGCPGHEIKEAG